MTVLPPALNAFSQTLRVIIDITLSHDRRLMPEETLRFIHMHMLEMGLPFESPLWYLPIIQLTPEAHSSLFHMTFPSHVRQKYPTE